MRNLIIVFFLLFSVNIHAQEVLATGGDYYTQTNGSLSYTIGETVVETYSNGNILTQGFQQDYENLLSTEFLTSDNFFEVYPNPFSSEIIIKYKPENAGEYLVELKDASGKEIYNSNYFFSSSNFNHQISVSLLSSGIYFLQLRELHTGEIAIFKLTKIN
ncbi:MAG: T9SS type A sorting domain-containing protein [Crocinitomicaceae bacterium]|nr:T9SS type A sorting domain-containing protein [Crocinitomicaceae bacterium]